MKITEDVTSEKHKHIRIVINKSVFNDNIRKWVRYTYCDVIDVASGATPQETVDAYISERNKYASVRGPQFYDDNYPLQRDIVSIKYSAEGWETESCGSLAQFIERNSKVVSELHERLLTVREIASYMENIYFRTDISSINAKPMHHNRASGHATQAVSVTLKKLGLREWPFRYSRMSYCDRYLDQNVYPPVGVWSEDFCEQLEDEKKKCLSDMKYIDVQIDKLEAQIVKKSQERSDIFRKYTKVQGRIKTIEDQPKKRSNASIEQFLRRLSAFSDKHEGGGN